MRIDTIIWQKIDFVALPDTAAAHIRTKRLVYTFHHPYAAGHIWIEPNGCQPLRPALAVIIA